MDKLVIKLPSRQHHYALTGKEGALGTADQNERTRREPRGLATPTNKNGQLRTVNQNDRIRWGVEKRPIEMDKSMHALPFGRVTNAQRK